jgi:hypothetical protein
MSFTLPPEIQEIKNPGQLTRLIKSQATKSKPEKPYIEHYNEPGFIIKSAANWLKTANKIPETRMLFDKFWFEGELCILFADTNVGKSILAVQIGESISKGTAIYSFQNQAPPARVLYFDFELTDKQFEKRYSSAAEGNYPFNKMFMRAVFNPTSTKATKFGTYEEFINNELENAIITTKAKVLIIDNITCLWRGTQAAASAIKLVRGLQAIKNRYKVSILLLAHTPKRNPVKPITRNDLQGSKMLINFCDSAFAIGESQSAPGLRYLKQIKQRSINEEYGADNVCLCRIEKPGNFLKMQFCGYAGETAHLMHYTEQYRKNMEARVAELSKQGLSFGQIASQLNMAKTTIFRILKRMEGKTEQVS